MWAQGFLDVSGSWWLFSYPVGPCGVLEFLGTGKGLEKTWGESGTMGQGEAMEVLKGGSSMLLPRIDGGCHPLDASQGSGSQNPGSMCSLPCILQREKRHVPTRTHLWAVSSRHWLLSQWPMDLVSSQ